MIKDQRFGADDLASDAGEMVLNWWRLLLILQILSSTLLVPWIKNHLSGFELGFLNISSRQNLLRSFVTRIVFVTTLEIWREKMSKKPLSIRLQPVRKTGKTIEKPLKELPWNQQYNTMNHLLMQVDKVRARKIETTFFKTVCLPD